MFGTYYEQWQNRSDEGYKMTLSQLLILNRLTWLEGISGTMKKNHK